MSLQEQWRTKFSEMRREFGDVVTGPFLSVAPPGYDPERVPSVLYVGKALGPNEQMREVSVQGLRRRTRRFLGQVIQGRHRDSGFWNFALDLSRAIAEHTGHPEIAPLQNLVWTNICKIGHAENNPKGGIYEKQEKLAIATLRAEIALYRPRLVFWATWNYGVEVVRKVVNDSSTDDASWMKDLAEEGIYLRASMGALPPMVWTYYPERKSKEDWKRWIECAIKLLDGGDPVVSRT